MYRFFFLAVALLFFSCSALSRNTNGNTSDLYMEIVTLPAFVGFTPIPRTIQDKNGNQIDETHKEIMEEFKNKSFQYITTFENQRIGYIYEIRDILRDITPEITYD